MPSSSSPPVTAGEIIFQGRVNAAIDLFTLAGFPCPENTNLADHLLVGKANRRHIFERREKKEAA